MRKISGCLILLSFFWVAACLSEVKPLLKPTQVDIPNRIANQQKWLNQAIASKEISRGEGQPVRHELEKIKEKYNLLQSRGELTVKDSETINRMLDECSDLFFRIRQKRQKGLGN